jgi:hypothetical protein
MFVMGFAIQNGKEDLNIPVGATQILPNYSRNTEQWLYCNYFLEKEHRQAIPIAHPYFCFPPFKKLKKISAVSSVSIHHSNP